MKAIWTEDEASYHGEFVNFDRIWSCRNRRSARTRRSSSAAPARPCSSVCSRTGRLVPQLRGRRHDRARDRTEGARRAPDRTPGISVPPEPKDLDALAQAGCTRACHWLPSANRSTIEAALAEWELAIAQFTGEA